MKEDILWDEQGGTDESTLVEETKDYSSSLNAEFVFSDLLALPSDLPITQSEAAKPATSSGSNDLFEYKPVLQYILDDINTIDNVRDRDVEEVKPYIASSTAHVVNRLTQIQTLLDEAKTNIENGLRNTSIPFDKRLLDDILKDRVVGLTDAYKLVNDGILTYQLYKEVEDDPILGAITDIWDEYHAGIDGTLEAELKPLADAMGETLASIGQFVTDTLLYDYDAATRASEKKIRENELLQVEKYLYLLSEVKKLNKDPVESKIVSVKKQLDSVERRLVHRKDTNTVLKDYLSRAGSIVQDIYDGTIPEFRKIQNDALREQLDTLRKSVSANDLAMKAIVYSSFKSEREAALSAKRSHKNILSKGIRSATFKGATKDIRLYMDVALPAIIDLSHMDEKTPILSAGKVFVSGLEKMSKAYGQSVLGIKNTLETSTQAINSLLSQVYDKQKTRVMYKLMG